MLRTTSTKHDTRNGSDEITLTGTKEEIQSVIAMLAGVERLSVVNGQLETVPVYQPVRSPIEDPLIPPNWATKKVPPVGQCTGNDIDVAVKGQVKPPRINVQPPLDPQEEGWNSPHYAIQHLCGYNWTEDNYKRQAQVLMDCGFECLRSRRGKDGRFWEIWYLPGNWAAQGLLKLVIDQQILKDQTGHWTKTVDVVVKWLCNNVSFGTLDVSVQRACMVMDG